MRNTFTVCLPLVLLMASTATGAQAFNAAPVTDSFDCRIDFQDPAAQLETRFFRANSVRVPIQASERPELPQHHPELSYTEGRFSADFNQSTDSGPLMVRFDVRYVHAIESDAAGEPTRAALWRCVTAQYTGSAGTETIQCVEPQPEPFQSTDGNWLRSSIQGGVPQFSVRRLVLELRPPEGTLRLDCRRN